MPILLTALLLLSGSGEPTITIDRGIGGDFSPAYSDPAILAEELLGKTHVIEGIYRPDQEARWSCYEARPTVVASGALPLKDGTSIGFIPLASQLPIPTDHVVQLEGVFKKLPCPKYPNVDILYFEPQRVLDKRDFSSTRKLVAGYHRKHAKSFDGKLLSVKSPGPSFTKAKGWTVGYDVKTKRLAWTTSASQPLAWHSIADYIVGGDWKRIEEVRLHAFFQGE